jgi:hypothetical protein
MSERALRAALAGVSAFAVGYLLPGTLQLPVLIYDPAARVATIARTASGVAMRYYGDLLVASAAGLVAAAAVWIMQPRRTPIAVLAGSALSLVALDLAFYLSRLLVGV